MCWVEAGTFTPKTGCAKVLGLSATPVRYLDGKTDIENLKEEVIETMEKAPGMTREKTDKIKTNYG